METKHRVLGYYTSKEITNEELMEVSGGSSKLTCHFTQKLTGSYPGNTDVETDQEWD